MRGIGGGQVSKVQQAVRHKQEERGGADGRDACVQQSVEQGVHGRQQPQQGVDDERERDAERR